MNATETSQATTDPGSEELVARLRKLIDKEPELTLRTNVKLTVGRYLHPITHTWVRHKRYDPSSDGLVDVGLVCFWCPATR